MMNKHRAIGKDKAQVRKEAGKLFEVFKQMQGEDRKIEILDECGPVDPELEKLLTALPEPQPKKKKATPESKVVRDCQRLLKDLHIFAWRNNTGAVSVGQRFIRYGHVGSADIIGLLHTGRFLAVECKAPGGKQSPNQKVFQMNIEKNGGLYLLVESSAELAKGLQE